VSAEPRGLSRALGVAAVYLGLFWTWAGVAKAVTPDAAYAFAARVVGGGAPAMAVVVASVVLETLLGTALLARAVSRRAGLAASLALLLVFTGLLTIARGGGGGALSCGCYAFFATSAASVDRELWINGLHAAILAGLLAVSFVAGRRPAAAS